MGRLSTTECTYLPTYLIEKLPEGLSLFHSAILRCAPFVFRSHWC